MAEIKELIIRTRAEGTGNARRELGTVGQSIGGVNNHLSRMGTLALAAGGALATIAGTQFVRSLAQTQTQIDKIENSLFAATGSAEAAQREFEFLADISDRLGLNLQTSATAYSWLAAAASTTSLTMQQTRDIFSSVATASTAMGLSADETSGTLTALTQIISKGKVSSEELRQQLGERLPGSLAIAARSMDLTTAEFNKLLESGKIMSEDFLPGFARELENTFSTAAERAASGLQANLNRMSTSLFDLRREILDGGLGESFAESIGTAAQAVDNFVDNGGLDRLGASMANIVDMGTGVLRVWNDLEDPLDERAEDFRNLANAIEATGLAIGGIVGSGVLLRLGTMIAATNPATLAIFGSAAVLGGLISYREEIERTISPLKRMQHELSEQNAAMSATVNRVNSLIPVYLDLADNTELTTREQERLREAQEKLMDLSPQLRSILEDETSTIQQKTIALKENTLALQTNIAANDLSAAFRNLEELQERQREAERSMRTGTGSFLTGGGTQLIPDVPESRLEAARERIDQLRKIYQDRLDAEKQGIKSINEIREELNTGSATQIQTSEESGGAGGTTNTERELRERVDQFRKTKSQLTDMQFNLEQELSTIGLSGMELRLQQEQNSTARMLREIQERENEIRGLENISGAERIELLRQNNRLREQAEEIGTRRQREIYSEYLDDRMDALQRAIAEEDRAREAQRRRMESEAASINFRLDPEFALDVRRDDLNRLGGMLTPVAKDRAENLAEQEFLRDQIDLLLETRRGWAGAKAALMDYNNVATDAAANYFNVWQGAIRGVEDLLTDSVMNMRFDLDTLSGVLNGIASDITRAFIRQSITGPLAGALGLSLDGARAAGGPVSAGGTYLVGERGPEIFQPDRGGEILNNQDTMRILNERALPGANFDSPTMERINNRISNISDNRQSNAVNNNNSTFNFTINAGDGSSRQMAASEFAGRVGPSQVQQMKALAAVLKPYL